MAASRELELELLQRCPLVAGIDEVGRGSLAGPVGVGVALVNADTTEPPAGLTDSKAMSIARRKAMLPLIKEWVVDYEVGYASAEEIDQWGIIVALRLAARRALTDLSKRGHNPMLAILDGKHDWLSLPPDLFQTDSCYLELVEPPEVITRIKADLNCSVVAAASVVAKLARDNLMEELDDPGYGWAKNKGYATPVHLRGLQKLGISSQHRRSWKLPGTNSKLGA